ncbi:MAG: NUDIX domain-containing protein [Patescibacteria group bacterium]
MASIEQVAYGIVVAIKEDEWKFLILLQDETFVNWSFPKGKTEKGETVPLDIAMRELGEETGITVIDILDCPLMEEEYRYEKRGDTYHRTNKYFLGVVKDKSVKIQEGEIIEYKWATYKEASETFVFKKESRVEILQQAQEYLNMLK